MLNRNVISRTEIIGVHYTETPRVIGKLIRMGYKIDEIMKVRTSANTYNLIAERR